MSDIYMIHQIEDDVEDRRPKPANPVYESRVRAAKIMLLSGYSKKEVQQIHGFVVLREAELMIQGNVLRMY